MVLRWYLIVSFIHGTYGALWPKEIYCAALSVASRGLISATALLSGPYLLKSWEPWMVREKHPSMWFFEESARCILFKDALEFPPLLYRICNSCLSLNQTFPCVSSVCKCRQSACVVQKPARRRSLLNLK